MSRFIVWYLYNVTSPRRESLRSPIRDMTLKQVLNLTDESYDVLLGNIK